MSTQNNANSGYSAKNNVIGGLFWTFGERIIAQLVTTLVTVVLARVLDPSHYGVISLVSVLISLCNVFVASGFGSALIQKKDADSVDFNTAFILSFFFSWVLYAVLFFAAPVFAEFYEDEELILVLRIMALRLPIAAINTIQHANVSRQMQFKRFFVATLFGTVISGIAGIIMALRGYGVWALVCQYMTNTTIDTIVLWFVGGWKPKAEFSITRAKQIFSFGWKVLATELTYNLDAELRSLIIGKRFGASDLAFYDQGKKYPTLINTNVNASISKVMLPAYSKCQEDIPKLKQMLRKSICISTYVLSPILLGFASVSTEFVLIVLGEKWMPAVPYIQMFCMMYLTRPLQTSCNQALLAIGRSEIVLYIIILNQIISLSSLFIAVFLFNSISLAVWGLLLSEYAGLICFMLAARKFFKYKIAEQLPDIIVNFGITGVMLLVIYIAAKLSLDLWLAMLLKVVLGISIFLILSILTHNPSYCYLKDHLLNILYRKKSHN